MITSDLIGHPLFQLNLLMFLSLPQPQDSSINPIFFRAGYDGLHIEKGFDLPPDIRLALQRKHIRANERVHPDVFLEHPLSRTFVPIECKKSFSALKGKQALALLTLNGRTLATTQGKSGDSLWTSIVTYLSPSGHGNDICDALRNWRTKLVNSGLEPAEYCCLEISHKGDGIYMQAIPDGTDLPMLSLEQAVRVIGLEPDEDPRPLYLISFVSEKGADADPLAEEDFREQLRQAFALRLRNIGLDAYEFSLDDLIKDAIIVWDVWDNKDVKKHIRGYAREFLRDLFDKLRKAAQIECYIVNQKVHIPAVPAARINKVRSFILSAPVRKRPMGPIPGHFDLVSQADSDMDDSE